MVLDSTEVVEYSDDDEVLGNSEDSVPSVTVLDSQPYGSVQVSVVPGEVVIWGRALESV